MLLWEMSKRDIRDRYVGQMLGTFWAILTPVLIMSIYLFIFAFVFKIRIPTESDNMTQGWGGSYTLYLLSGLVPWMSFQEIINRSTTIITSNSNLVKQVIFPLEVLPLKILSSAMLTQFVGLTIFLLYGIVRFGLPTPMMLLLPVVMFFQIVAGAGIALLFGAVGVFLRDLKDIISMLCFICIYLMPVFFTESMIPNALYKVLLINPLSHMILCYHDVLYWGNFVSPLSWLLFPFFSILLFILGSRVFFSLKTMFGNVL